MRYAKPMNATRKKWILGGLVLAAIIIVAAKYGEQLLGRLQNDHETARLHLTSPATLQPFDERVSLRMPVAFGSATEFPLEKLPVEVRGEVQKMTQRTAYFNGVYIAAMKLTNTPGTKGKVEDSLYNTFSRNANPPAQNKFAYVTNEGISSLNFAGSVSGYRIGSNGP